MPITLASPSDDLVNEMYPTLNDLVAAVNKHAKNEGYAVRKRRFKPFKKDVLMKAAIVCDAHGKTIFTDQDHRLTFSKRKKCSFRYNVKLKNNYENEHDIER